jgi:hypothetical protein
LLRKTNKCLASSHELAKHGIASAPCSLNSVLVLLSTSKKVLHALANRTPNEVLVDRELDRSTNGGTRGLGIDNLTADLVGHALELGAGDVRLGKTGISDGAGLADGVGVVGSKDHCCVGVNTLALDGAGPLAGQNTLSDGIEAGISVCLGVVEEVAGVRSEVRAPNQLHTKSPSFLLGNGQVLRDDLGAVLLVRLVCSVDDSVVGLGIVLAGILNGPVIDTKLEGILLCVEQKTNTTFTGELADGVDRVGQVGRSRETVLKLVESQASGTSEPIICLLVTVFPPILAIKNKLT